MKAEKPKRIFKMPPCPAYDIAGMEAWLTEMAAQGYVLKRFFTNLIAVFEVQEPQKLRYALTSLSSNAFSVPDLDPSLEQLKAYCADFGWEYVDYRGTSCIFVTDDLYAPELHTDSDVQAMTLEQVRKERKSSLVLPVFWTGYIAFQILENGFWWSVVHIGSELYLLAFLTVAFLVIDTVLEFRHLRNLRKALQNNETIKITRNSKLYQARTVMMFLSAVLLIGMTGALYYTETTHKNQIPLAPFSEDIPVPTITDMVQGETYIATDNSEYANYITFDSDLLAPAYIEFDQTGEVYRHGVCQFSGSINVEYMETRTPWLARQIAEEYHKQETKRWGKRYKIYEPLELPELDVDYAVAYKHILPAFILVEGNKMVFLYYHQTDGEVEITLDKIASMYANSLKQC